MTTITECLHCGKVTERKENLTAHEVSYKFCNNCGADYPSLVKLSVN